MVIDGKKLLSLLNLSEEDITPELVMQTLNSLSVIERNQILRDCIVMEDLVKNPVPSLSSLESAIDTGYVGSLSSDLTIKQRLKYEKSYLASKEMRRNLGPGIGEHGKHYKGCKRKRKVR